MLLNHVSAKSEVEAIYDTYKYLAEMREAMMNWENHFSALLKDCAGVKAIGPDATQLQISAVELKAA